MSKKKKREASPKQMDNKAVKTLKRAEPKKNVAKRSTVLIPVECNDSHKPSDQENCKSTREE